MKAKLEYTVKELVLSEAVSKDTVGKSNEIATQFKSIKIIESNSSSARVTAHFIETGEELLLIPGVPYNFNVPRNGVLLSWEAQSGTTVKIAVSQNEFFEVGPLSIQSVDSSFESDGVLNTHSLLSPDATASILIPVSGTRSKAIVEVIGLSQVFVGTLSACSDSNYANLCDTLNPGDRLTWRSSSALYARTASGTLTDGVRLIEFSRS